VGFRDGIADFDALGARVVGVSFDGLESHRAFAAEHGLNFPLVSDEDGRIASRYGVGNTLGYARRTTFVIGADGTIVKTFPAVTIDGHAEEVLATIRGAVK
jgi:peroxiredoxin Q/BCP